MVAGAFALGYGPVINTRVCDHVPPHSHLGPDCYDGFAAYRHREDALAFRAPDAALATVDLTGDIIAADSAVTRPGMRGEHQQVQRLEFISSCECGSPATVLRVRDSDLDGFAELRSSCIGCAEGAGSRTLSEVGDAARLEVGWLPAGGSGRLRVPADEGSRGA